MYGGKHQLQIPRSGANIQETEDDIIISYSEDENDTKPNTAEGVSVIGVQDLDIMFTCISCKANIEHHGSAQIAICNKCNTAQKLLDPKVTAKLHVQPRDGHRITVRAYTSILANIIGSKNEEITIAQLLMAAPFDMMYDEFHVIRSIHRN